VEAVLTGRLSAPLRILSGDPTAVETAVLDFLREHLASEFLRLDVKEAEPAFRDRLADATRLLLESQCIDPHDATDPDAWQFNVQIADNLGPAWAIYDTAESHLTICFWPSDSTMYWLGLDGAALNVLPEEVWCEMRSWHADVGGLDQQLGVLVDRVMYQLREDPESFLLRLTRQSDDAEVARSIIEFLVPPSGISESVAALYLLGLPCDGSLGEEEFESLASIDDSLEWMTSLIIMPPPAVVNQVRRELTERTTGTVRNILQSLSALGADGWDRQALNWQELLGDLPE
jgi:hypothetical protein